jgi:Flp pilus assembly protein TadG
MRNRNNGMRNSRGQSLVETALMVPFLLMLVLNAVNFGYFFLMMVNLTGASRNAATYSIEGDSTPAATPLPVSGSATNNLTGTLSVSYLTYQDLTGAIGSPTGASVQVCSPVNILSNSGVNGTGANQKSNCMTCTGNTCGAVATGSPAPSADPEAPDFVLNQVDITYTFSPIIPGTLFNVALLASPICTTSGGSVTCTFIRTARMRAMK